MRLVQVRKKAQVTLPVSVRRKLKIEEGDFLDIRVRGNSVILRPMRLIAGDQAWFWTKRWQEGEREAEAEIKAGLGITFPDAESAIAFLNAEARAYDEAKARGEEDLVMAVRDEKESYSPATRKGKQLGRKGNAKTSL